MGVLQAAAKRILISHMRLGFYDAHRPDYPFKRLLADNSTWSLLDSADHRSIAREVAAASTVLLKNENGMLPFKPAGGAAKSMAVIGPFAACESTGRSPGNLTGSDGDCYLHSYYGQPSWVSSMYGGIAEAGMAAGVATVSYAQGSNKTCDKGGGAIGEVDCAVDPASKFYKPAAAALIAAAAKTAAAADITVLCLGLGEFMEAESRDRVNMTLPSVQRALLDAVAKVSKKLVIVVVSAGGVDVDETKADAVLWAPYGGEEAGGGLADVLFGKVNPSARLPVTVVKQSWADAMNCPNFTETPGSPRIEHADCNTSILHLDLEEGAGRTHRYIRDPATHVKHRFGFGLSYTTFSYKGVTVSGTAPNLTAVVEVTNTGSVDGAEVVEVFASGTVVPGLPTPIQNLVGFAKVQLAKGATSTVRVQIDVAQLATAQADGSTRLIPGEHTLWAGGHLPNDPEGAAGTSGPTVSTTITL